MKRIIYLLPVVALIAFTASCNKPDDGGPEKFSQLSVEENKEIVEQSAIQMAETAEEMKNLETTDVAVSFGNILEISDPFSDSTNMKSKVGRTIHVLAGIKSDKYSIHDIFTAMKSSGELNEDPETLQEVWDEFKGMYIWNPVIQDWDYTAGGDVVVFKFPSADGGTTNDATFTVSDYTGVVVSNPLEDDYTGDLPVSLKTNLTVGGTELISYTFAASYNNDGIPTSVASNLTIESFSFSVDITNTDTEVSAMYKMTHGEVIVMDIGGTAKGLFTQENIDNNTVLHSETYTWTDYRYNELTGMYEEVLITEVDEWEDVDFEEVIHSADAHFQLYNIAIRGDVNIKALVDEINLIYPDDEPMDFDEKEATDNEAAAINKHLNLRAVNVSADEKIAEVEAYVIHDVDEYYDDYYIDFRLTFGDGSLIDLETYFEEGFEDFVAEINTLIGDLNQDYDWALEAIDY